jgi:nicotinate-nucleotide adenylyltransferase
MSGARASSPQSRVGRSRAGWKPALLSAAGRPGALRLGFALSAGMRVGLYGGSFNPAHEGHTHVAQVALRRLGLDRIIWLVSPGNPLKGARGAGGLDRRLAGAAHGARSPRMLASDAERRLGARYTLDTVRLLKARFPGVRFVWIMGADNLAGFHAWRGWTQIMRELPVAIVSRRESLVDGRFSPMARRFAGARLASGAARRLATTAPPAWVYLTAPLKHASSTALRNSS